MDSECPSVAPFTNDHLKEQFNVNTLYHFSLEQPWNDYHGWSHFSNAPCIENNARKIIHSNSVMSTHYSVTWLQRGLGLCHSPSWLQGPPTLVKTSSLHLPVSLRTLIIMGNVPIENHIELVLTFWLCVQDPLMILCCQALLSVWVWFGVDGGWCGGSLMSLLLNQELHYSSALWTSCNLIILTDYFFRPVLCFYN